MEYMKTFVLKVENGDYLTAVSNLFKGLLEKKIIDLLMAPQELPSGKCVVQTLVGDPGKITGVNPFAPVLMQNSAKLVSDLTSDSGSEKVGVVLRPCEIRAVVELVKLKQAKKENLFIIAVDCPGTYEVDDYGRIAEEKKGGKNLTEEFLKGAIKGLEVRHCCQGCEYPRYHLYDMNIGFIGSDIKKEIRIKLNKEDTRFTNELGLITIENDETDNAIKELIEKRLKYKEGLFKDVSAKIKDINGLMDVLSTCKRCYNCQRACPICYCRECIMCSTTFEYEMRDYKRWVERKGSVKLPPDTLLFHLTRLNHMAVSCIACGQCTSACPSKIQVADIFNSIGAKVQALFNYVPGKSYDDELPQATFREDELKEV